MWKAYTGDLGKYLCATYKNAIYSNMYVGTSPVSRDVELRNLCSPLVRSGYHNPATSANKRPFSSFVQAWTINQWWFFQVNSGINSDFTMNKYWTNCYFSSLAVLQEDRLSLKTSVPDTVGDYFRFVSLLVTGNTSSYHYLSVGQNSMEEIGEPRWTFLIKWETCIFCTSATQQSPSRLPLDKDEKCIHVSTTSQPKEGCRVDAEGSADLDKHIKSDDEQVVWDADKLFLLQNVHRIAGKWFFPVKWLFQSLIMALWGDQPTWCSVNWTHFRY